MPKTGPSNAGTRKRSSVKGMPKEPTSNMMYCFSSCDEDNESGGSSRSASLSPLRRSTSGCPLRRVAIHNDAISKATSPKNAGIHKRAPRTSKSKAPTSNMMYCFDSSEDETGNGSSVDRKHLDVGMRHSHVDPALSEAELVELDLDSPAPLIAGQEIKLKRNRPKNLKVWTDGKDLQAPSFGVSQENASPDLVSRLSISSTATRFVHGLIFFPKDPPSPPKLKKLTFLSIRSPFASRLTLWF
jgi:hypothetical protein